MICARRQRQAGKRSLEQRIARRIGAADALDLLRQQLRVGLTLPLRSISYPVLASPAARLRVRRGLRSGG
jgi:hypothetical protein